MTKAQCRGLPLPWTAALASTNTAWSFLLPHSVSICSSSSSSVQFLGCESCAEKIIDWLCVCHELPPGAMGTVFLHLHFLWFPHSFLLWQYPSLPKTFYKASFCNRPNCSSLVTVTFESQDHALSITLLLCFSNLQKL